MERFLARLESRFGRYALGNATYYLVAGQVLVFILLQIDPKLLFSITLDSGAILQGEFWRIFTWIFIPPSFDPLWILFSLYWLYIMGTSLEAHWGAFRFQIFWAMGILCTLIFSVLFQLSPFSTDRILESIAQHMVMPMITNQYLLLSLFLGFATLWPDYQIMVFFILPIKVKWLALISALGLVYTIGTLSGLYKVLPMIAVGNYLLFFSSHLLQLLKRSKFQATRARALHQYRQMQNTEVTTHRCPVCGITDEDPTVEFRFCNCEKCGEGKEFCLKHAWEH